MPEKRSHICIRARLNVLSAFISCPCAPWGLCAANWFFNAYRERSCRVHTLIMASLFSMSSQRNLLLYKAMFANICGLKAAQTLQITDSRRRFILSCTSSAQHSNEAEPQALPLHKAEWEGSAFWCQNTFWALPRCPWARDWRLNRSGRLSGASYSLSVNSIHLYVQEAAVLVFVLKINNVNL